MIKKPISEIQHRRLKYLHEVRLKNQESLENNLYNLVEKLNSQTITNDITDILIKYGKINFILAKPIPLPNETYITFHVPLNQWIIDWYYRGVIIKIKTRNTNDNENLTVFTDWFYQNRNGFTQLDNILHSEDNYIESIQFEILSLNDNIMIQQKQQYEQERLFQHLISNQIPTNHKIYQYKKPSWWMFLKYLSLNFISKK